MTSRLHPSVLSTVELLDSHRRLHAEFGDGLATIPSWAVELEKSNCIELQRRGFPSRYCDALAKAATTEPETAAAPSVEELMLYASGSPIGIDPEAVALVRPVKDTLSTQLYLGISSPGLRSIAPSILKAVQRVLPPGVHVALDDQLNHDEFIEVRALYALQLIPAMQRKPIVTTVKAFISSFRESAAAASAVFKTGMDPKVPFRILKQGLSEHIVTGVVLEPEVPDASKTKETEGDIYSEADIYKAMVWWMENARHPFAYNHVDHGGKLLSPEDVVILENWQARSMFTEGDQVIRKGTWMLSTRVRHEELWADIEAHKINSWSLGLNAMGALERISA